MQIVIDMDENVFTRLFDVGIEDYAIVNDDLFRIAKSIRTCIPLDKIRAEIEEERKGYPPSADEYKTINKVLQILDKYKSEMEERKMENAEAIRRMKVMQLGLGDESKAALEMGINALKEMEKNKMEKELVWTNEDAIKMLKSKMDGSVDTSYEWVETVRLAINALEGKNE